MIRIAKERLVSKTFKESISFEILTTGLSFFKKRLTTMPRMALLRMRTSTRPWDTTELRDSQVRAVTSSPWKYHRHSGFWNIYVKNAKVKCHLSKLSKNMDRDVLVLRMWTICFFDIWRGIVSWTIRITYPFYLTFIKQKVSRNRHDSWSWFPRNNTMFFRADRATVFSTLQQVRQRDEASVTN